MIMKKVHPKSKYLQLKAELNQLEYDEDDYINSFMRKHEKPLLKALNKAQKEFDKANSLYEKSYHKLFQQSVKLARKKYMPLKKEIKTKLPKNS
jgi:vacuolar-type H+-ATPase subunit H